MSENTNATQAGEGLSDEERVEVVAGQTDSASENADEAGKDWNGDPSQAPDPSAGLRRNDEGPDRSSGRALRRLVSLVRGSASLRRRSRWSPRR